MHGSDAVHFAQARPRGRTPNRAREGEAVGAAPALQALTRHCLQVVTAAVVACRADHVGECGRPTKGGTHRCPDGAATVLGQCFSRRAVFPPEPRGWEKHNRLDPGGMPSPSSQATNLGQCSHFKPRNDDGVVYAHIDINRPVCPSWTPSEGLQTPAWARSCGRRYKHP